MRIIGLFLALSVAASSSFAQTWGSEIRTGLSISTSAKFESAVDYQGIHFVYWNGGTLKYALFSPSGSLVRSDVTIDNSIGNYATISAIGGKLIAVYVIPPLLKAAYSSDAGATWTVSSAAYTVGYYVSGLATAYDSRGVHAAWNVSTSSKTYYVRYTPDDSWVEYKDVTDETGGSSTDAPSVTTSTDTVHVGYVAISPNRPKTRDYIVPSLSWNASQAAYSSSLSCRAARLTAAGGSLNDVHQEWDPVFETYGRIKHSARPLSSLTWTQ